LIVRERVLDSDRGRSYNQWHLTTEDTFVISLIHAAALVAAVSAPSAPATTGAAQFPSVSTPDQQTVGVERSGTSTDYEAIQQQLEMRVISPPLSGDGGA
jgi:hypothetical protein